MILEGGGDELLNAFIDQQFSIVNYDVKKNLFYVSLDKVLFSNPVETVERVLEANGYVNNLENILSCLDSFKFVIHARVSESKKAEGTPQVHDYFPCMSFELPQKHRVGSLLQRFYDEVGDNSSGHKAAAADALLQLEKEQQIKQLKNQLEESQKRINSLNQTIERLTEELIAEKQRDKQSVGENLRTGSLPGNALLCSVEHVDLKRRLVKVKSVRKTLDIPTHLLDRVPEFRSTCLVTLDKDKKVPLGILFFDDKELGSIERRVADLLVVDGDTFKARDSMRNEFQIKALNDVEAESIASLQRGMKILLSVAEDYVVRFSIVEEQNAKAFDAAVLEQMTVLDIGRNQLVNEDDTDINDD